MLLLGDRNSATQALYTAITDAGADFLIRAKVGTWSVQMPVDQWLPDGSYLIYVTGRMLRVIDAHITMTAEHGARASRYRLVTTMVDPVED